MGTHTPTVYPLVLAGTHFFKKNDFLWNPNVKELSSGMYSVFGGIVMNGRVFFIFPFLSSLEALSNSQPHNNYTVVKPKKQVKNDIKCIFFKHSAIQGHYPEPTR